MPAIFLTGASGTGKTTLAKAVAQELGIEFLPSSVATVYAEEGLTYDDVKDNPTALLSMQGKIMFRHCNDIAERLAAGRAFISDRALDCLVYTTYLCGGGFKSARMRSVASTLLNSMKRPDVYTVFVPIMARIAAAARRDPDNRRAEFLKPEVAYSIQGATIALLEFNNVPYDMLIDCDLELRTRCVSLAARQRGICA